jgi:hypothetical protein
MGFDETKRELIKQHFEQLQKTFSSLQLKEGEDGRCVVAGNLSFAARHGGKTVMDDYDIEITIPDDYPQNPPIVREIGSKIPKIKDNHINLPDETLCLGVPLAVRRTFSQQRNLLWFVREQVVRFLFSHSYKRDFGTAPYGELPHGEQGLIEYYSQVFSVKDISAMLKLLLILCDCSINEPAPCPCRSGQSLRRCHLRILRKIRKFQSPEEFRKEYQTIVKYLGNRGTPFEIA